MSKLADTVKRELLEAIYNDTLALPSLPEAALTMKEAAKSADISIDDLVQVIGKDTALTARIIQVANSPLLRARQEITGLGMAITRLGINFTTTIALGMAMQQMFQANSYVADRKLRATWSKCSEVASICYVLARSYTPLLPDQAALAGLIHLIGVMPILKYAEQHNALLEDPESLNEVISETHPIIGERLLSRWGFPDDLVKVPVEHLDFDRIPDEVDYLDVVQVAMLQSYLGTDHPFTKLDWTEITSFARLNLDPVVLPVNMDMANPLTAAMSVDK